jgi:lysophospholipase L1-like esterase
MAGQAFRTDRRQALGLLAGLPLATAAWPAGASAASPVTPARFLIEKGAKLVMVGDSITDAERAKPVGEGLFGAVGKGYVAMVDALLGTVYPDLAIRVVNQGISGNTVRDLKARWKTDVMDLKPDWVSIMIGTNDVWRQFDLPREPEIHVGVEEYEKTLGELVAETKAATKGLVLMTPFYIEPSRTDAMRAAMDRYGAVVKTLAAKHEALFVDTQAAFDAILQRYYPATLAWDRVHPNHIGQMVLARAFVGALGFQWNRQ